jgi:hypothetical protein
MIFQNNRSLDGTNANHDGHSSHFEGVTPQQQPYSGSHSDRAVRLYSEPVIYPSRIRVYSDIGSRVVE